MDDDRARGWLGIRWPDIALATIVVTCALAGTLNIEQGDAARGLDTLAVVCAVVAGASLIVWRRFTLPMVAVVGLAMFVYMVRGYPGGPALLPGPIAAAFLGYRTPRPLVWWVAGAFASLVVVGQWIGDGDLGAAGVIGTGWIVAAVFAGQVLAARGERVAADRDRRLLTEQQAITDERLRIARDLHDSVAHAMATINVQSGVAAHLLDRRPEQARTALEAIRQASSDVLDELGAILGALRRDEGDAPRAPTAGLDRLDELVDRSRADGLTITCAVQGDRSLVPPSLGTAAYRVVQEALSNTRRHAGPDAAVTVKVDISGPGTMSVMVTDDGGRRVNGVRPPAAHGLGLGLGLAGMRERVESTGGTLDTAVQTLPHHGFRVHATWGPRP